MTLSHISHTLPYSIEQIWDTVTDLEGFAWRSDIKEIKVLDEYNFIEVTKSGLETHFHTTRLVAYNTLEFDLNNESIEGHWIGSFRQQGHETLVDFTENVVAKKWFLKPLLAPYLKRQQKQYLKDLQHELERNSSI